MGGLGNGRRGGRSPPLMIGALIACILVLGFNYWVSSSRNLELQTKLYALEGQVRRTAAERGAVEMKKNEFQDEIQRQKDQIVRIENLYKRQLEGVQNTCSQDKGSLQLNISSSTKTTQELKGQLSELNNDLGKLQKELQTCQANLNTLNKKLTYDMTQCNTQILSEKELCDEKLAAVQKKMEKLIPAPAVSSQVNTAPTLKEEKNNDEGLGKAGLDETKTTPVLGHIPEVSQPKSNDLPELLTNEITMDKALDTPAGLPSLKDLSKPESVPSAAVVRQDTLQPVEGTVGTEGDGTADSKLHKKLTEDKEVEVMDAHGEKTQIEEMDPGMEDMLFSQGKADETPGDTKDEEPEDYDGDERIVDGGDSEKPQNQENIDKDMEEALADYNGDDENEGEFEADKQAALAQI